MMSFVPLEKNVEPDIISEIGPNKNKYLDLWRTYKNEEMYESLSTFAGECSLRGLHDCTIWATDLATDLLFQTDITPSNDQIFKPSSGEDLYYLAKIYFDIKDYQNTIKVLSEYSSLDNLQRFLYFYSQYLIVGVKNSPELLEFSDRSLKMESKNYHDEYLDIATEMEYFYHKGYLDEFELYLYGIILEELNMKDECVVVFAKVVNLNPIFFDAWTKLAVLLESKSIEVDLPEHWMRSYFEAKLFCEKQQHSLALKFYENLHECFPKSNELLCLRAACMYDMRSFEEAQILFEYLRHSDPYRLDDIDKFSDILYVTGNKAILSYLAHEVHEIDKYRPETCCILGNFFSLRSDHQKAVLYFKRALMLNSKYQSAWTLMGHEHLELKNPPEAIESYLKAVEINGKDYRAWYGLGQTYEILDMYFYALYYYRKSCSMRPNDGRMWSALGNTYELLNRFQEAIQCYKEASKDEEVHIQAICKLAQLYVTLNNKNEAARYFLKAVNQSEEDEQSAQMEDHFMLKACSFLAQYFLDECQFAAAKTFAQKVFECSGKEKEEAKSILLSIRNKEQGAL